MHRNYRVHQPIQIIRYANRIEIRNPGYSLIAEEHLGEPGSKNRNPKIAQVLYDTDFAEMKGSGIRIMREKMQEAGLSPPIFESDRSKDLFVATFLFHHFLGESDLQWLKYFKKHKLTDEQARALIFVREVGAIDNSAYRSLNHVDTLTASSSLRQLKEMGLLVAKNQGSATYYIPVPDFIASLSQESKEHMSSGKQHMLFGKEQMLFDEKGMPGDEEKARITNIVDDMPIEILEMIKKLGKKSSMELMEQAIIALCSWKALTTDELAQILKRDKNRLTRVYLTPMVEKNLLSYKFPGMPKHPNQAYITK